MITKKVYCPKDSDFSSYYANQTGSGFGDIRIIRAPRYQRGYGIGSFFSRLAMPLIRQLSKEILDKGCDRSSNTSGVGEQFIRLSK